MRYAQINANGVCIADSYLSGEIKAEDMILLAENEPSPLGKKYVNGTWQEVEKKKVEVPESDIQILAQQLSDLELAVLERGN